MFTFLHSPGLSPRRKVLFHNPLRASSKTLMWRASEAGKPTEREGEVFPRVRVKGLCFRSSPSHAARSKMLRTSLLPDFKAQTLIALTTNPKPEALNPVPLNSKALRVPILGSSVGYAGEAQGLGQNLILALPTRNTRQFGDRRPQIQPEVLSTPSPEPCISHLRSLWEPFTVGVD